MNKVTIIRDGVHTEKVVPYIDDNTSYLCEKHGEMDASLSLAKFEFVIEICPKCLKETLEHFKNKGVKGFD
jgi:hypothetical protein